MYLLKIRLFIWGGQVFPQDMPFYLGRTSYSSRYAFLFGDDKYFPKICLSIWGGQVFPQDRPLYLGSTSISPRYASVFREDKFFLKICLCIWGGFWNLLSAPLYREWRSEWGQSVFPNMTLRLLPPQKQLYLYFFFYHIYLARVSRLMTKRFLAFGHQPGMQQKMTETENE